MSGDAMGFRTESHDDGVRRYLVIDDFGPDGSVSKRVRIPLYGANVTALVAILKEWKESVLDEARAAP